MTGDLVGETLALLSCFEEPGVALFCGLPPLLAGLRGLFRLVESFVGLACTLPTELLAVGDLFGLPDGCDFALVTAEALEGEESDPLMRFDGVVLSPVFPAGECFATLALPAGKRLPIDLLPSVVLATVTLAAFTFAGAGCLSSFTPVVDAFDS